MGWRGHLQLSYRRQGERTLLHDRHEGPLRILRSLYPEAPAVCHNVLVHPPGGVVGGDTLLIETAVAPEAHALVTSAGATRFYRTRGEAALQRVELDVAPGGRLEWLPLESIAYSGCLAENRVTLRLAAGAESIGWDVLALGLPASNQPFDRGRYTQHLELPGQWLEKGHISADDRLLLDSPVGLARHRVVATLWFAAGSAIDDSRREWLVDSARRIIDGHPLQGSAGVTAPQAQIIVLRALAPVAVEEVMDLLVRVWSAWRKLAWDLAPCAPRVWRT